MLVLQAHDSRPRSAGAGLAPGSDVLLGISTAEILSAQCSKRNARMACSPSRPSACRSVGRPGASLSVAHQVPGCEQRDHEQIAQSQKRFSGSQCGVTSRAMMSRRPDQHEQDGASCASGSPHACVAPNRRVPGLIMFCLRSRTSFRRRMLTGLRARSTMHKHQCTGARCTR